MMMTIAMLNFCLGFSIGAYAMWCYFRWARLIRTRHEFYADPRIRRLDPGEADAWLRAPDEDQNWG